MYYSIQNATRNHKDHGFSRTHKNISCSIDLGGQLDKRIGILYDILFRNQF